MLAAVLTAASGVIPVTVVPALYPRIAEDVTGYTPALLGVSTAVFFGASSLSAPFLGGVADRIGGRISTRIVGAAVLGVLTCVAFAQTWQVLIAAFALGGIVQSLAITSSNLMMGTVVGRKRTGLMFGLKQSAPPALSMAAGLALAVATGTVGWRAAVLAFGIIPAVLLLVPPQADARAGARTERASLRTRQSIADLVSFSLLGLLAGGAVSTIATFTVVTLIEVGWAEAAAGTIFAIAGAMNLTVRVGAGHLVDRRPQPPLRMIALLLAAGCLGSVLIATADLQLVLVGVLLAYPLGWGYPGLMAYGIVTTFPSGIGSATGTIHVSRALGITAGPLVYSYLHATGGLTPAWMVTAGAFFVATLVAARLTLRHRRRGVASPST